MKTVFATLTLNVTVEQRWSVRESSNILQNWYEQNAARRPETAEVKLWQAVSADQILILLLLSCFTFSQSETEQFYLQS
jgi:hypothetical protein